MLHQIRCDATLWRVKKRSIFTANGAIFKKKCSLHKITIYVREHVLCVHISMFFVIGFSVTLVFLEYHLSSNLCLNLLACWIIIFLLRMHLINPSDVVILVSSVGSAYVSNFFLMLNDSLSLFPAKKYKIKIIQGKKLALVLFWFGVD